MAKKAQDVKPEADNDVVDQKVEVKAPTNMDMLREQQLINERIGYQAAQVKGQTFVRGK